MLTELTQIWWRSVTKPNITKWSVARSAITASAATNWNSRRRCHSIWIVRIVSTWLLARSSRPSLSSLSRYANAIERRTRLTPRPFGKWNSTLLRTWFDSLVTLTGYGLLLSDARTFQMVDNGQIAFSLSRLSQYIVARERGSRVNSKEWFSFTKTKIQIGHHLYLYSGLNFLLWKFPSMLFLSKWARVCREYAWDWI